MNKTNLMLLSLNLLLLGIMLGVGAMVAPRLMQGQCGLEHGNPNGPQGRMQPPHRMLEAQFGPAFHQTLVDKLEAAQPGWNDKIGAARARLQQTIVAEPFDAAAFKAASVDFDKLMDVFHATMRDEIHNKIINAPSGVRHGIAKTLGQMPLPLDEPGDGPEHGPVSPE